MLPTAYRVVDKRQELADTWTLELEPAGKGSSGAGSAAVADARPGQFNMLYAFGSGEVPISISGDVGGAGTLTHTVQSVGLATKAICDAEPGDSLGVRGPFGSAWPLAEAEGRDVVVVAGGIGLAPLRSVIRHLAANRDRYGAALLLYGSRTPDEILYERELEEWRAAGIEVASTVDSASAGWPGRVGLVTKLIPSARFDGAAATAMVCGPEVMMRFVAAALRDRGVASDRIHVSLERNMKCAIGHCGHCQLAHQFVCKDGAVFPYRRVAPLLGVREL
ncbi:MAG: FAD/NAD(P)-binding protein [bacterium]